jgi:hypothetical protein
MADPAGSSLLNIRDTFSRSTFSGSTFRGEDTVNKREFVEQSKKFVETQQKDQQSLSTIQQQINNLQTQINTLSAGLVQVRSLIQNDTVSEQTLLRKEQEEERKYAQRKIRTGNENQLEQKIVSALSAPVQQAAAKVENIFSRIGEALKTLFLGWLTVQGVKALKAYADKDYDALIDIKNNVIKNIGLGIAAIASIKLGLGLVTKAVTGVVAKIGSIIANIIKAPFKVVGAAATGLGSMLSGGGKKPPGGGGGKPKGGGGILGASGKFVTFLSGMMNFQNKEFTDATLASLSLVAKAPGAIGAIGKIAGIAFTADEIAEAFGKNIFGDSRDKLVDEIAKPFKEEKEKKSEKPASTAASPAKVAPAVTPQTPMIGDKKDDKSETDPKNMTPGPVSESANIQPTSDTGASAAGISAPSTASSTSTSTTSPAAGTGTSAPSTTSTTSGSSPVSTAQTTMMPAASDLTLNVNADKSEKEQKYWKSEEDYWNTISSALKAGSTYEELGLNQQEIDYLEGKTDTPPFLANEKMAAIEGKPTELTGEMMETKPITPPSIPPLQEPAPNVTIAAAPQQQQQKTAIPSSTGTDVPFIPSANPDNFYVMYSKLNYNVVV